MGNNNISFDDDLVRGKYAQDINWLLRENTLNWYASPSVKKGEIFIRPKGNYEWDSTSSKVSRISLQVKDNSISLGVSGYFPGRIINDYPTYKKNGFKYHDREGNTSPKEAVDSCVIDENGKRKGLKGRWWLTKPIDNFPHLINEFKGIEHLLFNGKD